MTTLPAAHGVVKLTIGGAIGSSVWACRLHFLMDTTAGIDNSQATQIAVSGMAAATTLFSGSLWNANTSVTSCLTEDLTSTSGGVGAASGSGHGTGSGSPPPAQNCTLVKHLIARRYRGGHPRTYLPSGDTTSMATSNTWNTTDVAALQTKWDNFINAILSTTVTGNTVAAYVNVSYYSGHALRSSPVIDAIEGSTVEAMIATQRRRVGR